MLLRAGRESRERRVPRPACSPTRFPTGTGIHFAQMLCQPNPRACGSSVGTGPTGSSQPSMELLHIWTLLPPLEETNHKQKPLLKNAATKSVSKGKPGIKIQKQVEEGGVLYQAPSARGGRVHAGIKEVGGLGTPGLLPQAPARAKVELLPDRAVLSSAGTVRAKQGLGPTWGRCIPDPWRKTPL